MVVVVEESLLTFERLLFFTHKKNNKMSSLGIRLRGVLFATTGAARTHAAEAMMMMRKTSQKTSSPITTFNRRTIFTSTKTPKASSSVLSGARANRMADNAIPRGFSGRNPSSSFTSSSVRVERSDQNAKEDTNEKDGNGNNVYLLQNIFIVLAGCCRASIVVIS